jgi:hypothetical protein
MRRLWFVSLFASLAACGDEARTIPVTVQWMDWPADVFADEAFRTRLVVWGVCALDPRFYAGAKADQSAVTFVPYFTGRPDDIVCAQRAIEILVSAIDTAGMAPGLRADYARTYEMRAAGEVFYAQSAGLDALPVRTFGDVTVRPWSPVLDPLPRRNAAGYAVLEKDASGCARIRPLGLYTPGAALVLENPVDTAGLSGDFVRGYIELVDPPVCGANRVFHLVSRD